METSRYPIFKAEYGNNNDKLEQSPNVPIIDIIRHGETTRKQNRNGFHRSPKLDIDHSDVESSPQKLDLNKRGIISMEESANKIINSMDIKNEVVLIVSSPAWRTHSSAIVLERIMRKKGIDILNAKNKPRFSEAINQHSSFFEKVIKKNHTDNIIVEQIIKYYTEKGWEAGIEKANEVLSVDVLKKMEEEENLSFQIFLRHMNNIYHWLSPATLEKLKGRKLRIIVLAHEETTREFIKETLSNNKLSQQKGQILEITPESELIKDTQVATNIKLVPKGKKDSEQKNQVKRGFNPD
jgi:phosphohistidine phosphatase SixA